MVNLLWTCWLLTHNSCHTYIVFFRWFSITPCVTGSLRWRLYVLSSSFGLLTCNLGYGWSNHTSVLTVLTHHFAPPIPLSVDHLHQRDDGLQVWWKLIEYQYVTKDGWDCCDWCNSNKTLTVGQIFRDILMVLSDFKVMQRLIEFDECCDCLIFTWWLKTQILLKANPKLGGFITLHAYNDGSHHGFLKASVALWW